MNPRINDILQELQGGMLIEHYQCEDTWYQCPLAPEGSANAFATPGQCDCGANESNAEILSLVSELLILIGDCEPSRIHSEDQYKRQLQCMDALVELKRTESTYFRQLQTVLKEYEDAKFDKDVQI